MAKKMTTQIETRTLLESTMKATTTLDSGIFVITIRKVNDELKLINVRGKDATEGFNGSFDPKNIEILRDLLSATLEELK